MQVHSYQLGMPRKPEEGLRIGAVRYLPRGVRKADYSRRDFFDVWLPNLAPSRELLRAFKQDGLTIKQFFRKYRAELKATEARQLIQLLAAVAERTPIAIGCYCEDESHCHRSVLVERIRGNA